MDINKKKLANERRLKAVQEWQKKRSLSEKKNTRVVYEQTSLHSTNPKITTFDLDVQNSKKNKLVLFESDEEDNDFGDCFKIRPQFEGKNGLQMLELNSELSDRFKLDERFKEEEPLHEEDEEISEKNKNIRILESVLGHEVSKKPKTDINSKRKRGIERFDPEDKEVASFIKNLDKSQNKSYKKIRKSEPLISNEEMPYSSERYIEVSSNLKDIMNTTSTFSFSEKFKLNFNSSDTADIGDTSNVTDSLFEEKDARKVEKAKSKEEICVVTDAVFESAGLKDSFFIADSDDRLKEGIEFFQRQKSEEEVRNNWLAKRNAVLEIFKRRRKSSQRGFVKKLKQNQRKQFPLRK